MKKKITRALSVRQPYADQILNGEKKFEYRTVPTNIRERVYIYASKKTNSRLLSDLCLPTGLIVGTVEIVGCTIIPKYSPAPKYYEYAWSLHNPKRLKRPLRPKNKPQPVWFHPF